MKNNIVKLIALILVFSLFFNVSALNAEFSATDSTSKLTEEVTTKLTEMSQNEKVSVLVYFHDDTDNIVSTMSEEYPEAYETYIDSVQQEFLSSNGQSSKKEETSKYSANLQNAIETKRELYKTHYEKNNALALAKSCKKESIMYISSYAPIAITTVKKAELKLLISNTSVKKISLFNNNILSVSSLENANLNSRADYVRDSLGNNGSGVKIGQVEPAVPSQSDTLLSSSNIITNTSFGGEINADNTLHATYVARIMVGNGGFAPSATLYAASASDVLQLYSAIDWLVSQGVNVINMSANLFFSPFYDDLCAYVDHLAVQHDVHFVVSAGNVDGLSPNHYIVSPVMAYNAITVGAYNDNATAPVSDSQIYATQKDDYIEAYSKYLEFESTNRPCKPNLVAAGNDFWGASGTSFAAPQVTGVIAQLCSYNPSLKTKQSCIGAILAASCGRKLSNEVQPNTEIISSGSFKGVITPQKLVYIGVQIRSAMSKEQEN